MLKEGTYFRKGKKYFAVLKKVFTTTYGWVWVIESSMDEVSTENPKIFFVPFSEVLEYFVGTNEIEFETWRDYIEKLTKKAS